MNAFIYGLVITLHVLICLILIVVVLLQQGKGDGGLGGLAGGGSGTVFGSRGPTTFFHYLTTGAAGLFIFTSLFLSCTPNPSRKSGTVIGDDTPTPAPVVSPVMTTGSNAAPAASGPAAATSPR